MKQTSETGDSPAGTGKAEESGVAPGRKDILKKILWVMAAVFAWLAVKRVVVTSGNEGLMLVVLITAAALVIWALQKMKW